MGVYAAAASARLMLRQVLHEVSEAYTAATFGISDLARHFLTLSLSTGVGRVLPHMREHTAGD
ncbi:MAG: hypothetical protein VX639_10550, partial [Pseudomonadota bacterium]|nr:hypothetical protein [Pseudomonadota bacterium]